MSLLRHALDIVEEEFAGKKDKAGMPYSYHCHFVSAAAMTLAAELGMSRVEAQIVGLLHDVVEDTGYTVEDIDCIFGSEIAQAVDNLTKRKREKLEDYLERVKSNKLSLAVKVADTSHNMQVNRFFLPTHKQRAKCKEYESLYFELKDYLFAKS